MKNHTCGDYIILGIIILIGLVETAHLTAVFLGRSFSQCAALLWILVGTALLAAIAYGIIKGRHGRQKESAETKSAPERIDREQKALYALFGAVVLSQLIFICTAEGGYRQGDMTVETVGSFLWENRIYGVNPLTGFPYTEGIPSRIKILCLPTLYASLCRLTGLNPELLVWTVIPALTLLGSYTAFACLGRSLFPGSGAKRGCFLLMVSLLLWAGAYLYGMDGFGLLCSGWRGVAIRNGMLVPWLLSLCIRKKWLSTVLCVLAEACIVWTFYGMGVCFFVTVGVAVSGKLWNGLSGKPDREKPGMVGKEHVK